MVHQARAMVASGAIGPIRQVHLQYVQGYLAFGEVPPAWRLDPARVGASPRNGVKGLAFVEAAVRSSALKPLGAG